MAELQPRRLPRADKKRAAVAAIFRERPDSATELLFIRRAESRNDRWSGHMAFPGGRVEVEDPSASAAAVRETREEVGFDLDTHGTYAGRLSDVAAIARGKVIPMTITPYVWTTDADPVFQPNYEVAEVLWVPMSFLLDPANRGTMKYGRGVAAIRLPCYRYEGRRIWGLTLKMLDELLPLLR